MLRRLAHAAGAAVACCLTAAVWFQVYRPLMAARLESRDMLGHLDGLWRDRENVDTAFVRQQAARETAARDLELWRDRVPEAAAEAELLGRLSDAAAGVGLRLDEFRVGGVRTVAGCPALEVRASLRADYADLCLFLDRIDRLPRLCRVPQFHIDAGDGADARHRVDLTLHVFFRPAAEPVAARESSRR